MSQILSFLFDASHLVLLLFLGVLCLHLWYGFVILYHLIRFGISRPPKILALIFFVVSLAVLILLVSQFKSLTNQGLWHQVQEFFQGLIQKNADFYFRQ